MAGGPTVAAAEGPAIAAAVAARTAEVVGRLEELAGVPGPGGLEGPSALDGWSRGTVACHLRYGARALRRLTDAALAGRPAAYYPGGRAKDRPATLVPAPGETAAGVVASLAAEAAALERRWASLSPARWDRTLQEPPGAPDLGPVSLAALALTRLTEVEVHGTDLDAGLGDWGPTFVRLALPFRLSWLAVRRTNHRAVDPAVQGSWLLVAAGGPATLVTVDGDEVRVAAAGPAAPADCVLEGSGRDLLALLLGRPAVAPLSVRGDAGLAAAFSRAFPGP